MKSSRPVDTTNRRSTPGRIAVLLAAVLLVCGAVTPASAADWEAVDVASGRSVGVLGDGDVHHVFLFATWCPPCLDELPQLQDLAARYEDDGYKVVLVAVSSRQSLDKLTAFADEHELPGRLLLDEKGAVQRATEASAVPTHIVFDADGNELFRADRLDRDVAERLANRLHGRN